MKHYDLICVGAGIANIALAIQFIGTDKSVLLLEKGKGIDNRKCPKAQLGKCVNCYPCHITTGFGGAGCFSDCKLTYSPDIGGTLIKYIGKDKFDKYLDRADKLFTEYGGKEEYFYNGDFANELSYECSKYGIKLVKGKVRHLGTDGSYEVMTNIYNALNAAPNIEVKCNADVFDVDFSNKKVTLKNGDYFTAENISIAVGRYGSEWLRTLCINNNIALDSGTVDIGVRVECPRAITDKITDKLYEFKLVNYSSSDNAVRTFCVNPGGIVTQENYDNEDGSKLICVNGHSYSDNKSLATNFALVATCHFTEPFNQPIQYAKSIARMCNMLSDNKPMVQRLVDLQNKKRSTKSRMSRLCYNPTLEAEPGDLRYVLPANIIDSITETLENLDNIMPGINGKNTILYAPELKFYSSRINVNKNLQSDLFPNIYFLGDSSGVTHGIIQSAMSGIYVSDLIKNKN